MSDEKKTWEFLGFLTFDGRKYVQDWYDELGLDAQDEIINLVEHLRNLPGGKWRRPEFDLLEGAGGISEIRPMDIRTAEGNFTYRIYGVREFPTKNSYTFLHGTDKDVKNDKIGKGIAKDRLDQLRRNEATVHRFDFEGKPPRKTQSKPGSAFSIC